MSSADRSPLSPRWEYFWALVGAPLLLVALVSLAFHLNPWNPRVGDLVQDWLSAKCYFDGDDVYASLDETVPRYLHRENAPGFRSVRINGHPPPSILLLLPLAGWEYPYVKLAWNVLTFVCVALAVAGIVGPWGLALHRSNYWPISLLVLISTPLSSQISALQINALLLLMLTAAWLALRHGRPWWAGAFVGVAASLKLFPLYLLVVFVALRQGRAAAAGVASCAAVVALSIAVFGVDAWKTFFVEVIPALDLWRGTWLNSSLAGFWARLFDPGNPFTIPLYESPLTAKVAMLLCAGALSVPTLWVAWRARTPGEYDRAFSTAIVAMILCSPTAWDHYWLMLALPLAVWWWTARMSTLSRLVFWICIVGLVVLRPGWAWSAALGNPPVSPALPLHSLTVLAYPTYCLLLFWFLLVTSTDHEEEEEEPGGRLWNPPR